MKFWEIFTDFFFLFRRVDLPAPPKKRRVDTHSCIALLSCGDQSDVGRNVVFSRILWRSSSPISHHITRRAPTPTLTPENCNGWLVHAPGAPTNKISSGDEIATPLASFQLGLIITGFPRGLKNPPQHRPPLQPCSPIPLATRTTPLPCCESCEKLCTLLQHRERCDPANFQK